MFSARSPSKISYLKVIHLLCTSPLGGVLYMSQFGEHIMANWFSVRVLKHQVMTNLLFNTKWWLRSVRSLKSDSHFISNLFLLTQNFCCGAHKQAARTHRNFLPLWTAGFFLFLVIRIRIVSRPHFGVICEKGQCSKVHRNAYSGCLGRRKRCLLLIGTVVRYPSSRHVFSGWPDEQGIFSCWSRRRSRCCFCGKPTFLNCNLSILTSLLV